MANTLSHFPITRKWPPRHPERLQLYSLPTPNGVKVSIALEETGLPYEAHRVGFDRNDQHSPEFVSLSPNNKIPAIVDPQGPDGQPLRRALCRDAERGPGDVPPADPRRRTRHLPGLGQPHRHLVDGSRHQGHRRGHPQPDAAPRQQRFFTMVAVDDERKPAPVPPLQPASPDEQRRFAAAELRRTVRREMEQRYAALK